jgi:hypothetical protein
MSAFHQSTAHAEMAPARLTDMYASAVFVGLVKVENITPLRAPLWPFTSLGWKLADTYRGKPWFWGKTAVARVLEAWKGVRYSTVSYRAAGSPDVICDESTATVGEVAVVFLDPVFPWFKEIAWSGQGRLAVIDDEKGKLVEIGSRLPPLEIRQLSIRRELYTAHYVYLYDLRRWVLAQSTGK